MLRKIFFLCFVVFSFGIFCFARDNNVFYESENDRILQLIEDERKQEELYAKKQEEKRLKKLKKLEEKEKKKLLKSANKSKKDSYEENSFNVSSQSSTNLDDMENFDVLADYVKNKQNDIEKEKRKETHEDRTFNVVESGLKNSDNLDNRDGAFSNNALSETKFKNFEVVKKIPSKSKFNDRNDEIIVLRDAGLKTFKESVKSTNKVSKKNVTNKSRREISKGKKSNDLRKQRFKSNKNVKQVYFRNDSSYITDESKKVLDSNVLWLKHNTRYKILIVGHTDKLGKTEYNLKLGQDRANNVKEYFIKSGIDNTRIQTISYGSFRSKTLRNEFDRRVEILLYI